MLRVAMVSKWHVHASWYAQQVQEAPDACVTCVWDEDPQRGEEWARELNVPFEKDYDALLRRDDVDAVLIDTPTSMHKDVIIRAARAGKHVFTEKCLCLTVKDCDEVIREMEGRGLIFTISFPQRCVGQYLFIKQMVDEGRLGDITVLRVRTSHAGALDNWLPDYWYDPEAAGGGAMMDLGAHPMYLARWLLGKPQRIQSMFNGLTGRAVEDNSVCTIEFENKAIAIVETSLVTPLCMPILEVYGTKGTVLAVGKDIRMATRDSARLVDGGWFTPKLPPDTPSPLRQWIDAILYDKPVQFGLQEARQLTELMEKAYIADREKREVLFD